MPHKLFGLSLAALLASAAPAGAAELELRHVVAKVVVITEPRSDIAIMVLKTNPRLPLRVQNEVEHVRVVDGGADDWWSHLFGGHISRCRVGPDGASVHVAGVGDFSEDELPKLLVRMPLEAKVSTSGAVIGSLPSAESLALSVAGCDSWTIGQVKGRMKLDEAGEGRVRTGDLGSLEVSIAGSATVTTKAIAHGYKVSIGGEGDLYSASADGPIDISIAGRGHVRVNGGHTESLKGSIAGDGELTYEGLADQLSISVAGSARVHVAHVAGEPGPVDQTISGLGQIRKGQ